MDQLQVRRLPWSTCAIVRSRHRIRRLQRASGRPGRLSLHGGEVSHGLAESSLNRHVLAEATKAVECLLLEDKDATTRGRAIPELQSQRGAAVDKGLELSYNLQKTLRRLCPDIQFASEVGEAGWRSPEAHEAALGIGRKPFGGFAEGLNVHRLRRRGIGAEA